jgi:hypothetical protein
METSSSDDVEGDARVGRRRRGALSERRAEIVPTRSLGIPSLAGGPDRSEGGAGHLDVPSARCDRPFAPAT